jgi:N-methylhydantoinase B/oxoprolinase/acetone carboxylase alpha subunit
MLLRDDAIIKRVREYLRKNNDVLKAIFDREGADKYDTYMKEYQNNNELMITEAIGKLIGRGIVQNTQIELNNISNEKKGILQRFLG